MPKDAYWIIPSDQFTDHERNEWAITQIKTINDNDKNGGYFTSEIWLSMASAYNCWWKDQKSIKASASAKKRKSGS